MDRRTATGEGLWFVFCAWLVDGTRNESFLQRWCLLCVWRKSIDRKIEQIVSWCCSGLREGDVRWGGNGNNKWTALISLGKDQVLSLDRPQENPFALFVRSFVQSSFLPFFRRRFVPSFGAVGINRTTQGLVWPCDILLLQ